MRPWVIASATLFAIGAILSLGAERKAAAGTVPCREVYGAGGGYICGAELDSAMMDPAFRSAQTPVECWAESMALIIKFSGSDISQSEIIASTFGASPPDVLAPAQVQGFLNHSYPSSAAHSLVNTTGTALFSSPIGGSRAALRSLSGRLTDEMPLLVFTSRNAMVLTALYYHADIFSKPTSFYAAAVRDACPNQAPPAASYHVKLDGHPGERFLTGQEYNDIQYVFQVDVTTH